MTQQTDTAAILSSLRASPLWDDAREILRTLRDGGYQALLAGGCVRDALLGRPTKDIDIATAARPDQVEALFPGRTLPVGKAFGVILVKGATDRKNVFEIATFRADGDYRDGRHPDEIRFADAEADAQRRDFTINGLFFDPQEERLLDFVGGIADLAAGIVRAIGDPSRRFAEDKLRMLRAVRFAGTLGFALDEATATAIRDNAGRLRCVSAERIGQEFSRMLAESRTPSVTLERLHDLELLPLFLPEVENLRGVRQPPRFHPEGDVWTHTCMMLDRIPAPRDLDLAYAILLHDIGKPRTTFVTEEADGSEKIQSPCHADVGADMVPGILTRLKQPSQRIDRVEAIVRRHMTFINVTKMRRSTLRRFMGAPTFPLELELNRLDILCSCGDQSLIDAVRKLADEFANEPALPPALVKGRDLIAAGLQPGKRMGKALKQIYDHQLETPDATREDLLAWARENGR